MEAKVHVRYLGAESFNDMTNYILKYTFDIHTICTEPAGH